MWSVETEMAQDALGAGAGETAAVAQCGGRMYTVSVRQQWDPVGPRRPEHRHAVE